MVGGGAALVAALLWAHPARAALHHAGLVIEHSSGRLLMRCVAFAEAQITGMQLIERSNVEYQAQPFGALGSAVCQLDGEPSTVPSNCFGTDAYWQYFRRQPIGWQPSTQGASVSVLHDGDLDGWHYAAGTAQPPASVTFATVCAPSGSPPPSATHPASATVAPAVSARTLVAASSPTPSATSSLEALAPSASPSAPVALGSTGPPTQPASPAVIGPWLLFGGATTLLLALGVINLRRRGP